MKNLIVKVQRPISTNVKVVEVLVYNKDRTIECMFPITDELKKWFGNEYKIFMTAKYHKDGTLQLIGMAPWQNW